MRCPFCAHGDTRVLESRPTEEGSSIRRRRECLRCGERFTTYERVELAPLIVIKRDGTREEFNRQKILRGLLTACEKRPVPLAALEQVVTEIENELRSSMEQEISSQTIGEMVMERLRSIDQVAYVRFASVYRQFKDINRFLEELQSLLSDESQ